MSENTAIDPKTGNPVVRTTPVHTIKKVYANNGMVVIVGVVDGKDVESIVERREAIHRAQAINEMAEKSKYNSDREELHNLVGLFIEAIQKAAEQSGTPYKSIAVSMAMPSNQVNNA